MSSDTSQLCVYLISDLNFLTNTTHTLSHTCFDPNIVTSYEIQNSTVSDYSFNSMIGQASDMDTIWLTFAAILVFFMQLGFTMLESGVVKAPNVQHILFKNLMDTCFASVSWYLFGYCVAFGTDDDNGFIGTGNVALSSVDGNNDWKFWFYQFCFATTSVTIVSGCVAERCTLNAYAIYTILSIVWIYPTVAHWIWDDDGWLSAFNEDATLKGGVIDFAGCGVVHMVGGFSGLIGAIFLGPRLGRFTEFTGKHERFLGNNVALQVIGMFVLWLGWWGFNCGSTLAANNYMNLASKIAVNTTFSGAAGGMTAGFMSTMLDGFWSVPRIVNGVLVGCVSVTSACALIPPGLATVTGVIGALVYYWASRMMVKFRIDDPLDAFAVHGMGGVWGMLVVALFSENEDILLAGYNQTIAKESTADRFGHQLVAVICIIGWVCANCIPLFATLKHFRILRVSVVVEEAGLDWAEHGANAVSAAYMPDEEEVSSMPQRSQSEKSNSIAVAEPASPPSAVRAEQARDVLDNLQLAVVSTEGV